MRATVRRARIAFAAALVVGGMSVSTFAQPATGAYEVGQTVEVREGDQWSAATVKAREGRRIQIAYDDGTEEWVTADRIRVSGATPAAGANAAGNAAPATKPAAEPVRQFAVRSNVQVKWGGMWRDATVEQRRGPWYLIRYDRGPFLEWVEPWRIRKVGDTAYDIEHARPNDTLRDGRVGNPPKPQPDPAPKPKSETAGDRPDPFAPLPIDWPVTEVDDAQLTVVIPAETAWGYQPAASTAKLSDKPVGLRGGATNDVHERIVGFDINGDAAMLAYENPFRDDELYIETVDLTTGRPVYHGEIAHQSKPASVVPGGRRVVAIANGFHGGTMPRVDVWDLPAGGGSQAKAQHVVSFEPYRASSNTGGRNVDVSHAIAVDADHIVTANPNGELMGLKVAKGSVNAIWQCKLPSRFGSNVAPAISPDRKAIAVAGEEAVYLLDAMTGQILGSIATGPQTIESLDFRSDGKRLLGVTSSTLFVFDLESGKQSAAIALAPALLTRPAVMNDKPVGSGRGIRWLSGDTVWIAASGVALNVADFTTPGLYFLPASTSETRSMQDRLIAVLRTGNTGPRGIVSWKLPPQSPANARAAAATPLPRLDMPAGTPVAVDVGGLETTEEIRTAIAKNLSEQIADRGWKESADAAIRIVGRSENGRTEQRTYQQMGGAPWNRSESSVSVTEKITRLTIESEGKPVWEIKRSQMPSTLVQLKEGQSMQEAVDATAKANVGFLQNTTLPDVLFQPMDTLPADLPIFLLQPNGSVQPQR